MPKLSSSREVVAALERSGFDFVSQRGTLRSILRQSGLDERALD